MESAGCSAPLHLCKLHKRSAIFNRSYSLIQSIAITGIIYYRFSSLPNLSIPHLLVFASELILSFLWLLNQAYLWKPVSRTTFPENLQENVKDLPAIDVFICTADPEREPPLEVMNTVLSAMALDYPPHKLSVYLSDDWRSAVTLHSMRQAWLFGRSWLPFCTKFQIQSRCPKAYFSSFKDDNGVDDDDEDVDVQRIQQFKEERENVKQKYKLFEEECMKKINNKNDGGAIEAGVNDKNHPFVLEVMHKESCKADGIKEVGMPLLVYVSREKRPTQSHHFKAGALNVLLRVSGMKSNSPYILVLDCDMYCHDPKSALQAMCFHLDPKVSPSLAFVQFPQKFQHISANDIYDSQLRTVFMVRWPGMDGLQGPMLSGTGFYMKREALYADISQTDHDLVQLRQSFGQSNEFINSLLHINQSTIVTNDQSISLQEFQFVGSCTYEEQTQWGKQVGFLYNSILEDYFTGLILHCKGWRSIFCNPERAAFLGSSTINLNDTLFQGVRWNSGLTEVSLSRFCPLIYGLSRMSILQTMCYAYLSLQPFYSLPLWCLATIPQLCLLNGIEVYPKVSDSCVAMLFLFIFMGSLLKHLEEVLSSCNTVQTWWNEQRIWMIKSVTAYTFGLLDGVLKCFGIREASFLPTNKVADEEQINLYQKGEFNFQVSSRLLYPIVGLVMMNTVSFCGGIVRVIMEKSWSEMLGQVLLSFYILVVNYPVIEGMVMRKDKGCIPPSVSIFSSILSLIFLAMASVALCF